MAHPTKSQKAYISTLLGAIPPSRVDSALRIVTRKEAIQPRKAGSRHTGSRSHLFGRSLASGYDMLREATALQSWRDVRELAASQSSPGSPSDSEIFESTQMKAEVPRVLHALAVPEYMEAWIQVPETERIECRSDPRSFDRFCIDLFSGGRICGSIRGSCLLTKPNRITYLWERSSAEGRRSLVEIRLWAYPARCILSLRHSGLTALEEMEWYSRMWRDSLHKLCALMDGTGARSTYSMASAPRTSSDRLTQSVPGVR